MEVVVVYFKVYPNICLESLKELESLQSGQTASGLKIEIRLLILFRLRRS
jgi:hypothetical protein